MQMKEKICSTGLLLGTNSGCITTNPNQSELQCNGNIPVHILVQPKRLRLCHQLGRLCLLCFANATPHKAGARQERIQKLQWELFEHPPYSPDLVPSDLHLFHPLLIQEKLSPTKKQTLYSLTWYKSVSSIRIGSSAYIALQTY
jgi:hypothetical protein